MGLETIGSLQLPSSPIQDHDVQETMTADVVVVGAGISGMMAALSASCNAARTIVIEKHTTFTFRGAHNAAIGSRLQKSQGIHLDKAQVVADLVRSSQYAVDAKLLWLWADNSGQVMDYLLDMAAVEGIEARMYGHSSNANGYKVYDTAHVFGQGKLLAMMEKNAKKQGVDFYYKTPAVQLIMKESSRVTGVIAGTPGNYIRINATKGVVLCTGDYGSNHEMIMKYCPRASQVDMNVYPVKTNTGDGHQMGLSIGAAMQKNEPHAAMIHNHQSSGPMAANPWLRVNRLGERYENEDMPMQAYSIQTQPSRKAWAIFDDKYPQDVEKFDKGFARVLKITNDIQEKINNALRTGRIVKADTLQELAHEIGIPVETFEATVARYNVLAQNGRDEDFGKNSVNLTTITQAPFYALPYNLELLVTLGGFDVNRNMQILDKEAKVIPGLYAAGNTVGNMFHGCYPIHVPGLSHGLAETSGWVAGKRAAAEKV